MSGLDLLVQIERGNCAETDWQKCALRASRKGSFRLNWQYSKGLEEFQNPKVFTLKPPALVGNYGGRGN